MRFKKIIALLLICLMLLTVLAACDTTNNNNGVTDGDDTPADKTEQENNDGDEPLPCLKNFYPWMNELRVDAITQVRYEHGYIGVAPGNLINISYSTNSQDIANAYRILSSPLQAISLEEGVTGGGSYVKYDFFTGGNTTLFSIRINNKTVYFNGHYYRLVDSLYKLQYSYLDCHSFITYWDGYEIYTYANESVKIGDYEGLGKFEFKLYDGLIDNAPSFRLVCDGVELLIFSGKQFAIKGDDNTVTYQITGDKDFSFLFTSLGEPKYESTTGLDGTIANEIIDAFVSTYSNDREPVTADEISLRFYGVFDGVYALFVDVESYCYLTVVVEEEIAGVQFVYSSSHTMTVYSNGAFYSLEQAYDNGILSQQDLLTVQKNYIADHQYLY